MNFTTGRTYRFKLRNKRTVFLGTALFSEFCRVYLRHVGKVDLFRHPTAGWLESFTRAQLSDYEITEMKKSPSDKGPFRTKHNKVRAQ